VHAVVGGAGVRAPALVGVAEDGQEEGVEVVPAALAEVAGDQEEQLSR
jgi:hypothetical protein